MQIVVRVTLLPLLFVVGAAAGAQSAAAQAAAQRRPNPHFARLDTDKDGFLSYQEARKERRVAEQFALFDENRDGKLSENEFLKLKAAQSRQRAGVHVSDSFITARIKAALLKAKGVNSADVHVETVVGTVTLRGTVDDAGQVARVAQLAARVKGVKKIDNRLTARQEAGRK